MDCPPVSPGGGSEVPEALQKRKTIKANSDYELNQKLMRFAVGRGFTFDLIRQCIDVEDELVD